MSTSLKLAVGILSSALLYVGLNSSAEEKNEKRHSGHSEEKVEHSEKDHDESKQGEGHKHSEGEKEGGGHDEHGGGAAIGPDKGIAEKGPEGLKFSSEAIQTIGPTFDQAGSGMVTIPLKALVKIKETKTVFRVRDGWYKRVSVEIVNHQADKVTVRSSELKPTDKVVSSQAGFLRMAEVISEEGAAHSH